MTKTNVSSVRISDEAREIINRHRVNVSLFLENQLTEHFSSLTAKKKIIEDYKQRIVEMEQEVEGQEKRTYKRIGTFEVSIIKEAMEESPEKLDELRKRFNGSKMKHTGYGNAITYIDQVRSVEEFKEIIEAYKKYKPKEKWCIAIYYNPKMKCVRKNKKVYNVVLQWRRLN